MKVKKKGKHIIRLMASGELPEQVADFFNISIDDFNQMVDGNKYLTSCYKIGYTKLMSYYQRELRDYMTYPDVNKDAMKLFYSNFLSVMDRKPEPEGENDSIHETEFE